MLWNGCWQRREKPAGQDPLTRKAITNDPVIQRIIAGV